MRRKQKVIIDDDELSKLVINKTKINEVRQWMNQNLNTSSILILTGPPGCGKTTLIQTISKVDKITLKEIKTISIPPSKHMKREDNIKNFILKTSQIKDLFSQNTKQILVFDEQCTIEWLVDVLANYAKVAKMPLIITVNEAMKNNMNKIFELKKQTTQPKQSEIYYRLESKLQFIQMNQIPMTALKKCFAGMDKNIIDTIVSTCNGDLRIALNTKEVIQQNQSFKNVVSMFDSINFFHLIGRILYTQPELNFETQKYEIKHKPMTTATELMGHEHVIPIIQQNVIATIKRPVDLVYVGYYICIADVLQKLSFYHHNYSFIQSYLICGSIMCITEKNKWQKSDVKPSVVNQANVSMIKRGKKEIEECQKYVVDKINESRRNAWITPFNVQFDSFCEDVVPCLEIMWKNNLVNDGILESHLKNLKFHSQVYMFVFLSFIY